MSADSNGSPESERRDLEALPLGLAPMLATSGELPLDHSGWVYETKWDGVRALAAVTNGTVRLWSRAGNDLTHQFPELEALGRAFGAHSALFDGEIVAFGADGKPSFNQLQQRLGLGPDAAIQRSRTIPTLLLMFDLLHLDGHSTRTRTLETRLEMLDALQVPAGPAWHRSTVHVDGSTLAEVTREAGLEGVMAKRLGSTYTPGMRSRAWIKVKHQREDQFVIGGWVPGSGRRASSIGSLLLGVRVSDDVADPRLRWVGRVGTGFTDRGLRELLATLIPLVRPTSPFAGPVGEPTAVFVDPIVIARVEYHAFTPDGLLRFASYRGIV